MRTPPTAIDWANPHGCAGPSWRPSRAAAIWCSASTAWSAACSRPRRSRAELATLAAKHYDTWILSGDSPARVTALARELGIDSAHAVGGMNPDAKAQWIAEHDRGDLLMIGDGINDSLAVQRAFTSGTPSIDRAFMPWRTDFYFVTPGIAPIGRALAAARRLQRVVRGNQVFAVLYNVAAVAIALAGAMRPWMAAVLMPLSSIVVLAATSFVLSPRRRSWKS